MKFDVCVVGGCGHVGLPLALCFAKEGKSVSIFDVNQNSVEKVSSGIMPFNEECAEELLKSALEGGLLHISSCPDVVSDSETVIIVLGTPIDAHLNPSFAAIARSVKECLGYFRDGQLIVLRSTVYPGTTEKINKQLQDAGLHVDVAFCPERILEGKAIKEIYELPQLIAAFSPEGYRRAREVFSVFRVEMVELLPMEAELAKLYSNVWRYICFGVANQFYTIAEDHGLDYYKIRDAMQKKYSRAKDLPKAGFAAGPCLLKDTVQLSTFCNNTFFLGHSAMLVNEGFPAYIVNKLKAKYDLHVKVVGIIGMAFKGDSDDPRWSLAYKLRKILEIECREVLVSDPYVKDDRIIPLDQVVEKSDILILGAPHKVYKSLADCKKPIIDVWNFFEDK